MQSTLPTLFVLTGPLITALVVPPSVTATSKRRRARERAQAWAITALRRGACFGPPRPRRWAETAVSRSLFKAGGGAAGTGRGVTSLTTLRFRTRNISPQHSSFRNVVREAKVGRGSKKEGSISVFCRGTIHRVVLAKRNRPASPRKQANFSSGERC